ncbi:RsmB/NOP family class I SAM-dependent RNA methyltransferase [Camelimonas abortus]|uniref:RsmB/NOP family class I SAM-dependent RNA methyltransferase n=1 Tax=Camelimonas abortus TaxID=1017184 RepID=A0ABV7LCM0_9HYPH
MTPAARVNAAIDVLAELESSRRPAPDVLRDWGRARRYAGSRDRAAVATLVYDCLRRRLSAAFVMDSDSPRAVVAGMLAVARGMDADAVAALFSGERHAPAPLTQAERAAIAGARGRLAAAPLHVRGDFPEWLAGEILRAFGDETAVLCEMQALCERAPVDIRVNTLKADPATVLERLAWMGAQPGRRAPAAIRLPPPPDGQGQSLQADEGFVRGWFEVQDQGSQLAALYTGAAPGETVVDLCAGAGGKTLALAAMMRNEGRLLATDVDPRRLAALYPRLDRAGVTCVEARPPRGRWRPGGPEPLADVTGAADLVLVDAPCTGTGTWRRNPDAKWRLRPGALAERRREQEAALERAAPLVRPGGRLVYVTCSVLPQENDDAVAGFLARHPEFVADALADAGVGRPGHERPHGALQLTPARSGVDGFYVASLRRR